MSNNSNNVGRGKPPADPLRFLRRLKGREPSSRQQARIFDLQRQFDLQGGDSIFIVVAILEIYLQQVEAACLGVRRSTRKILWTACVTAAFSAAAMVTSVYLLDPQVRFVLGWHDLPAAEGQRQETQIPLRAFFVATVHQMPDVDVARIASSGDAMMILQALPQANNDQLAQVRQYLSQALAAKPR